MDAVDWCEEQAARLRELLERRSAALDARDFLLKIRLARKEPK